MIKIVELLGFEQLEFIQELLTNRRVIVDTILNEDQPTATKNNGTAMFKNSCILINVSLMYS